MKGTFQIIEIGEPIETEPLLKVVDGKIFVEGVETIDTDLIGMAFKDFVENIHESKNDFNSDYPNPII